MEDEALVRVDTFVIKEVADWLKAYSKEKYRGNRRLAVEEAVVSLMKRKGGK